MLCFLGSRQGKTIVQDTPVHKQYPLSKYRKDQFERISGNGVAQIVKETPEKSSASGERLSLLHFSIFMNSEIIAGV